VNKVRKSAVSATACHQGSTPRLLGPTLFSIYINNIAQAVGSSLIYVYADDTVSWPLLDLVLNAQQQSFLSVQQAFFTLNRILNTPKSKIMWFGKKNAPLPIGVITTSIDCPSLSRYQSCRLKLNLDSVSSIVTTPLSH
jgi:hypothetical protein